METKSNRRAGTYTLLFITLLSCLLIIRVLFVVFDSNIGVKKYNDPKTPVSLVRGSIYDRYSRLLAIQAPDYVFKIKEGSLPKSEIVSELSDLISLDAISAEEVLRNGADTLELNVIPNSDDIERINRILKERGLDSFVSLEIVEERKYPLEKEMGKLLGDVDTFFRGQSGIEKVFDERLSPEVRLFNGILSGEDIYLTIDEDLEWALEDIYLPHDYTLAVFNSNGETIALLGNMEDDVLLSLELREETENPLYSESYDPTGEGKYRIYITEGYEKESIESAVVEIMESRI